MEQHPLLKELTDICTTHNLDLVKAQILFETYIELLEVKKFYNLDYGFNENLKLLYILGKKDKVDDVSDVYIPVLLQDTISPEEIDNLQQNLCDGNKKLYIIIKDRNSLFACYQLASGLIKPDSPSDTKNKKIKELKEHYIQKSILNNKKKIYTKILKQSRNLSRAHDKQ